MSRKSLRTMVLQLTQHADLKEADMASLAYRDFTFCPSHLGHFKSLTVIMSHIKVIRQRGTIWIVWKLLWTVQDLCTRFDQFEAQNRTVVAFASQQERVIKPESTLLYMQIILAVSVCLVDLCLIS